MERLKPHMLKHCTGALSPSLGQWNATAAAASGGGVATPSAERRCPSVEAVKEEPDAADSRHSPATSDDGTHPTPASASHAAGSSLHQASASPFLVDLVETIDADFSWRQSTRDPLIDREASSVIDLTQIAAPVGNRMSFS